MVNQENGVDLKSATQSDERKLFIETYGCQMNVADSEVVASIMKMDGYSMTENIEEADAIFVLYRVKSSIIRTINGIFK